MKRTAVILAVGAVLALAATLLANRLRDEAAPDPMPPDGPGTGTTVRTVTQGGVSLSATLSGSHVLRGDGTDMYLDIAIQADPSRKRTRAPLNVGLVIDRSGSMAGSKLDDAKEAARRLIASLRDGDRVALVTYGSDVTLFPSRVIGAESRVYLREIVNNIVDGGGTYLSGGFERARDEVLRVSDAGVINRVILISDGQANEGISDTAQLSTMARAALERGLHLTTMGVGLDFNEMLMTAMAENGGGHYYFIEDSSALAAIFAKELETLTHTVARQPRVTLTLERGVRLVEVLGYTYDQDGQRVILRLPDIFGGQRRKIVSRLRVPADRTGSLAVAAVELDFVEADSGRRLAANTSAAVMVTDDDSLVARGKNREVLARAEQAVISKNLNQAMESYGSGDVSAARARIQAQIANTMRANKDLRDPFLTRVLGKMRGQLRATEAAPSSPMGQSLLKSTRFDAYQMAK